MQECIWSRDGDMLLQEKEPATESARSPATALKPGEEYERRLSDRRQVAARLARRHSWIGNARLAVFGVGLAMAALAFAYELMSPWWLLAPLGAFGVLVVFHEIAL